MSGDIALGCVAGTAPGPVAFGQIENGRCPGWNSLAERPPPSDLALTANDTEENL